MDECRTRHYSLPCHKLVQLVFLFFPSGSKELRYEFTIGLEVLSINGERKSTKFPTSLENFHSRF